jgi:hypothetical protein
MNASECLSCMVGVPRRVPPGVPPHVHSLLIKFEQAGEIPPVKAPPDFIKWSLYILQLGFATSCTAPGIAPARARASRPREPGSNLGLCKGAFSPRAPARLRLRRTPVAVACGEELLLYIRLETVVDCFAGGILHAHGGAPFAVCCGGAAAMGCKGATWGLLVACTPLLFQHGMWHTDCTWGCACSHVCHSCCNSPSSSRHIGESGP